MLSASGQVKTFYKLFYGLQIVHNGNWTSGRAIWSEIIRVISKSNERAARLWLEIRSMISDQNCTTTFLDPFLNRTI